MEPDQDAPMAEAVQPPSLVPVASQATIAATYPAAATSPTQET